MDVLQTFVLGIDPGANGAACVMTLSGAVIQIIEFSRNTERDIADAVAEFAPQIRMAYLEKVHAMPKQGVSSTFKFGNGFGFIRGVLTALKIPFQEISPHTWQKNMDCASKGNKNVTKSKAQQLFPDEKITHGKADAILIAEYGRRLYINRVITV
jgi:crossover junction endodeoxyribonuclease RuvC